jgi:hypothetical protein
MTKWAGRTPKYRQRLSKKETSFFENRVFGVEVHCGPVSGTVLFHNNELVRGGANFVIEVQRKGIQLPNCLWIAYKWLTIIYLLVESNSFN